MSILGAAGIAVCAVFLALYLKTQQKEIAAMIAIAASVLLFASSVSGAQKAADTIWETASESKYADMTKILIKALGIAGITQITADVCREAGEAAVGAQLEMFGKVEILLLSLPLAARLLRMAEELLA